jgi:hypothetical protein
MMETTFAEILLVIVVGYVLYRGLSPLQKHLELVFVKILRRLMGRSGRSEKPVIDISSRKER